VNSSAVKMLHTADSVRLGLAFSQKVAVTQNMRF
jgi:hypothetical protein